MRAPRRTATAAPAVRGGSLRPRKSTFPAPTCLDRRQAARFQLSRDSECGCEVWTTSGQVCCAEILDVGTFGLRILLRCAGKTLAPGERVTFAACTLPHWGPLLEGRQGVVRWCREEEIGVLLAAPLCSRAKYKA